MSKRFGETLTVASEREYGRDLTVYGDGSQTRSFCYVDDMVRGLRVLMDTDGLHGEVVNLGSDHEVTTMDLADTILSLCDTKSDQVHEPLPEDGPSRRRPDLSKARNLLDFDPETDLGTGLNRTIKWFANSLIK